MTDFELWLKDRFGKEIVRSAVDVRKHLQPQEFGEKIRLITKSPAYIYIPYRFVSAGLAYVEDTVKIISEYALCIGDFYTVANVPAMVEIKPESRKRIKILDQEYLEFSFDASSVLLEDCRLYQDSSKIYGIFNEEIAKGNVPLYFNDVDFLLCLDLSEEFGGLSIAKNNVSVEMIVSSITRSSDDLREYYRKNPNGKYSFIALRDIQLGATNTLSQVMGSYYELGITSALARESNGLEEIEELLRL